MIRSLLTTTTVAMFGGVLLSGLFAVHATGQEARALPMPVQDETGPSPQREVAVLAGGCFWGVQGVFQHVRGVTQAVAGYAGGGRDTAQYETVSTGSTGHAESVQVTFDPHQISYGRILDIYFSVAHDPTELNYQGPDSGTQYRSAIFPTTPAQAAIARAYIAQLDAGHLLPAPIVTRIEPGRAFYAAEGYHQNFLARNPDYPYIAVNDLPKVAGLRKAFPEYYRPDAAMVPAS